MVQPCMWFKEEPSQFSMGQTAHNLFHHGETTYRVGCLSWESYSRALEQGTLPTVRIARSPSQRFNFNGVIGMRSKWAAAIVAAGRRTTPWFALKGVVALFCGIVGKQTYQISASE